MNPTIAYAWAIALGNGHNVGVFRFQQEGLPAHLDGQRTALWATRSKAREALKWVKGPASGGLYPDACVIRVAVRIGKP